MTKATWLLLRGLTRETAHWGSFAQRFEQCLPDAHTIALDLPGNGTRHRQTSPLSIAALVDFCRGELARMGVEPPYHVLAMSMGAMVAAHWAQQTPQEIAAAVLINTSMRPFNPFYQRLRPAYWGTLLRLALLPVSDETLERQVLRMTTRPGSPHEDLLTDWVGVRQLRPVRTRNAVRQLLCAARFTAQRQPPAVPILLLGSCQDQLVSVQCTRALAQQWACSMALHPTSGHDLPLDAPDWVAQQVAHWLATHQAQHASRTLVM